MRDEKRFLLCCQSLQQKMHYLLTLTVFKSENRIWRYHLNASYHHSCKNAYNNRMYERLIEKEKRNTNAENEDILKSPPTKRRSTVSPNIETPSQAVCCFCKCIDIR